jgi:hypothetical protein
VLSGRAQIDPSAPPASAVPAYAEKYASSFTRLGMTPEQFSAAYPERVTIELNRLRGH